MTQSSTRPGSLVANVSMPGRPIMSACGAECTCRHGSLPAAIRGIPENICSSQAFLRLIHKGPSAAARLNRIRESAVMSARSRHRTHRRNVCAAASLPHGCA